MKTTANFRNILISATMLISALSFTACSASDDSTSAVSEVAKEVTKATNTYNFKLKALTAGTDITSKGELTQADLFIFDKNNDFVQKVSVDASVIMNRRTIQVTCPGSEQITVIAWGGLNSQNESVAAMSTANIISDLTVSLKQNNGIANVPSDMFYGQMTLTSNQTKADDAATLTIERKVAAIDLLVQGIEKKFGTTEGDFYVKVKSTKSSFNNNGELGGNNVEYIIPCTISATGCVAIDKTNIIPASNITVELYRNDVLVFATSADKNGNNLEVAAGSQIAIKYDLSRAATTIGATAWNVNYVWGGVA